MGEEKDVLAEAREQSARFLRTELRLALTFTSLALEGRSTPEKIERNQGHARSAYDAVLRFLPRITLTPEEKAEFEAQLTEIRVRLSALGEVF